MRQSEHLSFNEYLIHIGLLVSMTKRALNQDVPQVSTILGSCHKRQPDFDTCMQKVLNDLRRLFKTGIPDYNVKPFDPHRIACVEARRGNFSNTIGFKLVLRNVAEYGWSDSEVTNFRTDWNDSKIIYSQYFPEKSLEGLYELTAKILGSNVNNTGTWNLTLYDYSQTTSVTRQGRAGGVLRVLVKVDNIGGMKLHISDFFGKRHLLNNFADIVINSMWKVGLPFFTPLVNELVSSAFTEIFNQSFQNFPLDIFIKD